MNCQSWAHKWKEFGTIVEVASRVDARAAINNLDLQLQYHSAPSTPEIVAYPLCSSQSVGFLTPVSPVFQRFVSREGVCVLKRKLQGQRPRLSVTFPYHFAWQGQRLSRTRKFMLSYSYRLINM